MPITETFWLSDYGVWETRPSRIAKGELTSERVGVRCPRCKAVMPIIPHGRCRSCECGLHLAVQGNALICRLDDEYLKGAPDGNPDR